MPTLASLRDALFARWTPVRRPARQPASAASVSPRSSRAGIPDVSLDDGLPTAGMAYPAVAPGTSASPPNPPKGFARCGGRVAIDWPWQVYGDYPILLPPDQITESWRLINLAASVIRGMPAPRLMRVLADLSPDVSRSLWDFLRLVNPGWECEITYPNSTRPHPAGQAAFKFWTNSLTRL